MHKKRMLMSLMFALSAGAIACGGADDSSVEDSTESLKWGYAADGGSVRGLRGDSDEDSDEDSEEATEEASDGGKHGGKRGGKLHVRGDGGCSFGARGEGKGSFGGGGHGDRDEDADESDDSDDSDDTDDTDDKPRVDGGGRRGPGWIDGGVRR